MKSKSRLALVFSMLGGFVMPLCAQDNPFLGGWALTLPGGAAGWLGVSNVDGALQASLLWAAGSVEPVQSVRFSDNQLVVTRLHRIQRKDASGKTLRTNLTETITASANGDAIYLVAETPRENGGASRVEFAGKRIPPVGPDPDLSTLKLGPPIVLFNGKDLEGWRPVEPNALNGWSVQDGLLVNRQDPQQPGSPRKSYANLRTEREFNDFNLTLETRLPKDGNSGVYLRGIYEVQVADTFGKPLDSHNMGAIYSRIKPAVLAEKPAGEWQTLDITFVKRHATVILNGRKIIDNQPVLGCTGGALWSDVFRPGPILLQGDHTGIEYRNLVLRPVLDE
jgi:hypothetical protein